MQIQYFGYWYYVYTFHVLNGKSHAIYGISCLQRCRVCWNIVTYKWRVS